MIRRTGLEIEPIRVGGRSRRPISASVAGLLIAFVAVAVAKPWAAERPSPPHQGSVASTAPVRSAGPAAVAEAPATPTESPPTGGGVPMTLSGDGWDAVGSAVRSLAIHSGEWGAGTASWAQPAAVWSDWTGVRARPAETPGTSRALATSACRDAQLRGSSDILAVTGPAAMLDDVAVSVWRLRPTPYEVRAQFAIETSTSTPGVAFFVPPPGESWPDGAYRLILRSSTLPPVGLDVCVGPLGRQRLPIH